MTPLLSSRPILTLLGLALLTSGTAGAGPLPLQDGGGADLPEGHSGHGDVFNEGPRQAAYLMDNPSSVHLPVTVATEDLQRLFDQGVGHLHGFWYFEAERTFRQVAAEDPDCAMAYWGMAMANVDHPERAAGFARVAWLKRGLVDERERMYIDAVARYHDVEGPEEPEEEVEAVEDGASEEGESVTEEDAEEDEEPLLTREARKQADAERKKERAARKRRAERLVKDYEEILWAYPDDIEAKAFLANRLWLNRRLGISLPSRHANEALLQQVFAREPMHPAHHYRIHLWDAKDSAEHVVSTAVRSGPSWPNVAHMWHMGGHIFARLGRHVDAAWQQEASARVDHAYMMRDRVLPDRIFNFAHNNEWLSRSLRHQGRIDESIALSKNMIELPRHPRYNTLDKRGCSASYGRQRLLETLALAERWDELAELAGTMVLEPSEDATDGALRAYALGTAALHRGDEAAFEEHVATLEAMLMRAKLDRAEDLDATEERALSADFEPEDLHEVLDDVLEEHADELDELRDMLEALSALRTVLAGAEGEELEESLELLEEHRFEKTQVARLWLAAAQAVDEGERREELLERAVETAREATERRDGQLIPHATLAHVLFEAGETEEALELFDEVRSWSALADQDLLALQRLAPLAEARELSGDWRPEFEEPEDVSLRRDVDLDALGPLRWTPPMAPDFACPDAFGGELSLASYEGRPVIVIFFLGFGCVHCVEQLQAFGPATEQFTAAGIEIVTIGTNSTEELAEAFGDDPQDTGYPFPVLADPELEHFRTWRAHDDFEEQPLHGTFLIDGKGRMRWQDVSYEPFMDWEFLLEESQRLLGLPVDESDDRQAASGR